MDSEQTVGTARGRIGARRATLKRLVLAGVSAFIAVNFWTGAPVAALWVGSAVVGERELSMTAVFVVVIVLGVLEFALAMAFVRINAAHDQLTGRKRGEQRLAWLHSMNTQGQEQRRSEFPLSGPERIVVVTVYVAVIALIGWFFLFAGSPLPR
jgi:hypothetical protein